MKVICLTTGGLVDMNASETTRSTKQVMVEKGLSQEVSRGHST